MITYWFIAALICYALSTAGFVMERAGVRGRLAGVAMQTGDLVMRGLQAGNIPVTNIAQSLEFLAWLTAIAGIVLIVRWHIRVIGAFVSSIVLIALGVAGAMSHRGRIVMPRSLHSAWLPVHVTLALAGY